MPKNKQLIVVLGAHRSGTSLCTAAIECLGADLGLDFYYANEENKKGFFEHPQIIKFNDQLLSFLGVAWDNPLFNGITAISETDTSQWEETAKKLLLEIFKNSSIIAIKDPRMCQLLGFWKPIFKHCGYTDNNTFFVHIIRDPVEVALSQYKRAIKNSIFYDIGREPQEGAALWISLTAQALIQSKNSSNNYMLSYQRLLDHPESELNQLSKFLKITPIPKKISSFCQKFIDKSLHRSIRNIKTEKILKSKIPQIFEFHNLLQACADKKSYEMSNIEKAINIFYNLDTQAAIINTIIPTISRLSLSCQSNRSEIYQKLEVINKLQIQKNEDTTQNNSLSSKNNALTKEIEMAKKSLGNQVEKLKKTNENLKIKLDNLKNLQKKENKLQEESHTSTLERLETRIRNTQTKFTKINTEKEYLQKYIQDLTADREGIRASMETENKKTIDKHNEYITPLKKEIIRLNKLHSKAREDRLHFEQTIQLMQHTISWKITTPLRLIRKKTNNTWFQFSIFSKQTYKNITQISPCLARNIKKIASPIFNLLSRVITGKSHTPLIINKASTQEALTQLDYQQPLTSQEKYQPLVTIIVPNFNHAPYLRQRLDSIYTQTYTNYEVILMDDCSKDSSKEILEEYYASHPKKTRIIINKKNSGGVFYQWEKGLNLANGEIIWIAESDDWCSKNFLSQLVPYFHNEAIQLAYSKTLFMNGAGTQQIWSINEYLHDIHPDKWNHSFVETAHNIVKNGFGVKNIIPNVSSALMRKSNSLEVLNDPQWKSMQTCGDWVLYLHLIRGGLIAYSTNAHNYYRIHNSNTSVSSYSKDSFYSEHETVAKVIQQHYSIQQSNLEQQKQNLIIHWKQNRKDFSEARFQKCYSLKRIKAASKTRKPNLLMAGFGFCAGGGETFPIQLANLMKSIGYNITYLDFNQEPRIDHIRQSLRADISVISNFPDLNRIIHEFGIDIIHSHHAWVDNTILDLLPKDSNCRTIVTLHGMYETINNSDLKNILPRLVDRSSQLIYTAEKNLGALKKHNLIDKANIIRIDNALGIQSFKSIKRAELNISDTAFVLTLVSRAIPDKGWLEAIKAVNIARKKSKKDIQLILIGEGSIYKKLKKKRLPKHIHLLGFQMNIRGYFSMSQMGFLPSRFHGESFPLVVIDCLHAGKPVLASSVGEIPYMLKTETGISGELFKLHNWKIPVSELGKKIALLATDEKYYNKALSEVSLAAKKFDPKLLRDRYDVAYTNTLPQNKKSTTAIL